MPKKKVAKKTLKKKPKPRGRAAGSGWPLQALAVSQFKPGNQWWDQRSKHGREKLFADPQLMWEAAREYFINTDERDNYRSEWRDKALQKIPLKTPYTIEALCLYMGVAPNYFRSFKYNLKKTDPNYTGFSTVIALIEATIYNQKYEGAASGHFNANLISYDLGVRKDVQDNASTGVTINVQDTGTSKLLEDIKTKLEKLDEEK
jgi:hypothetical protein